MFKHLFIKAQDKENDTISCSVVYVQPDFCYTSSVFTF